MTETQRKVYKWQERPESCPECDSTCFISSGGHNLTCYHCFLSEGWDKAQATVTSLESENAELRKELDRYGYNRCAVCGWLLIEGCERGNCSMRPSPDSLYDPQRYERERARGAIRGGTNVQE